MLKPPSITPLTMLSIAELVDETAFPPGALSVLPMTREVGDSLVTDPRIKLLSFTGSPEVGWAMKARAGKKKVVLELGSNSAAVVDESADVAWAAERCAYGAFKYSGQLCISVQRVLVHEAVWDEFVEAFLARARAMRVGDPLDPATDIGPMIDVGSAERAHGLDRGGTRRRRPPAARRSRSTARSWPRPCSRTCRARRRSAARRHSARWRSSRASRLRRRHSREVNDSRFGLQAGVFTNDLAHAWQAYNELEVGQRDRQRLADLPG